MPYLHTMENSSNQPSVVSPSRTGQIDFTEKDNLANIAAIILILGLVSAVIVFFSTGLVSIPSLYGTGTQTEFNGVGIALTIGTQLSSVSSY